MKRHIRVSIANQTLQLWDGDKLIRDYQVSTALNGGGEAEGSGCTPRGEHVIRARIGGDCPSQSVFVGRRATGEVYSPELAAAHPERDWILSRILWLSGRESGVNRGGNVDSLRRYIYIHGTPDTEPMGIAKSHGCVRMRNRDVIELFDLADTGMQVRIDP